MNKVGTKEKCKKENCNNEFIIIHPQQKFCDVHLTRRISSKEQKTKICEVCQISFPLGYNQHLKKTCGPICHQIRQNTHKKFYWREHYAKDPLYRACLKCGCRFQARNDKQYYCSKKECQEASQKNTQQNWREKNLEKLQKQASDRYQKNKEKGVKFKKYRHDKCECGNRKQKTASVCRDCYLKKSFKKSSASIEKIIKENQRSIISDRRWHKLQIQILEENPKCFYCGLKAYSIDYVKNFNTFADLKKSCVPLCKSCFRKKTHIIDRPFTLLANYVANTFFEMGMTDISKNIKNAIDEVISFKNNYLKKGEGDNG